MGFLTILKLTNLPIIALIAKTSNRFETRLLGNCIMRLPKTKNMEIGLLYVGSGLRMIIEHRVDLAILEMDAKREKVEKVIALIEFKAHSIARPEPSFYCLEFKRDVEKMLKLKDKVDMCKCAELYFVFLETGQNRIADKYQSILGFSQYQTSKCVYFHNDQDTHYLDAVKSHWEAFNKGKYEVKYEGKRLQPISIPDPKAIEIGEAYGYTQYISPLIIGPLEC